MTDNSPVTIDALTGELEPVPRPKDKRVRYRAKLDTLTDIKSEMSRIYREVRSGMLDPADGTRIIFILKEISKITQDGDIEKRLEALERLNHARN